MKHAVIGILAHVDAGKTTLSESMLYLSGKVRKAGRVDHGDTFLDYDTQEKNRGITIYSKQAVFRWKESEFTLIDTPGHIDFSAEMERTLQVLDYAIVIISGLDGVQIHTETIWSLLKHYQIPAFVFVNKMDVEYNDKEKLMDDIQNKLDARCIDFSTSLETMVENVAMTSDTLLEEYTETQMISNESMQKAIFERKLFPCFFGSALKMNEIDALLDGLDCYMLEKTYPDAFGARVFKITRDEAGNKLTHVKVTGGSLKVKEKINENEKVDQIRIYSGNKYEMMERVNAGSVCALKGLDTYAAGDGMGYEANENPPVLSSYLRYRLLLPQGTDMNKTLKQLQQLSEEDPQLHVRYEERNKEISVQLMGEVQIDVLKQQLKERFDLEVEFDQGSVLYKETIQNTVEGVGHYEPLRHYSEVHLLMEPAPQGSGLVFASICPEENLAKNWQQLVLTHLQEKEHIGVLTGSPITDMKITLIDGRAHQKHTEGGDFREATYRAIRHGLKCAESVLLEPYYQFRLEIPSTCMSRAIFDIEKMQGTFELPKEYGDTLTIIGEAPVSLMQNYQSEVHSYTKGKGRLFCSLHGYRPCINQEEEIEKIGYDSESDVANPCGSVFCSHGAGFVVPWNEVVNHMHIKSAWHRQQEKAKRKADENYSFSEKEVLSMLFPKNQGTKRKQMAVKNEEKRRVNMISKLSLPRCVLVDGYNVIYSWESLSCLAKENLDAARMKLIDLMCSYQGYRKCELILVFDAYQVNDHIGQMTKHGNIHVVYTKTAQTADSYIEEATHKMAKDFDITVVTSDAMIQLITIGQGAYRMSARELEKEVEYRNEKGFKEIELTQKRYRTHLLEDIRNYQEDDEVN